jgi:hypothetical protein
MGGALHESLYGLLFVAVAVATLLAAVAFVAPMVLPEPFAGAAARSDVWIVATASLTVLWSLLGLLALRLFV